MFFIAETITWQMVVLTIFPLALAAIPGIIAALRVGKVDEKVGVVSDQVVSLTKSVDGTVADLIAKNSAMVEARTQVLAAETARIVAETQRQRDDLAHVAEMEAARNAVPQVEPKKEV